MRRNWRAGCEIWLVATVSGDNFPSICGRYKHAAGELRDLNSDAAEIPGLHAGGPTP